MRQVAYLHRPPTLRYSTKVIMWGGVPNVVNHVKFHQNRFRDFGSMRDQNLPFSMVSAIWLYMAWPIYQVRATAQPVKHI